MSGNNGNDRDLADRYARMSDGELEKIAAAAYELTEAAASALRVEIERRGLAVDIATAAPSYNAAEFNETVTVQRYRDLSEAMFAKGLLEAEGIDCFLSDENMARMNWFYSNALGGIRLQVHASEAERASEILSEPIPEEIEMEGEEAYVQPRCPGCGSLDVSFESINKPVAYTTMYVGIPLPVRASRWKCADCGKVWVEDAESADSPAE